jgi:hypothetical protein
VENKLIELTAKVNSGDPSSPEIQTIVPKLNATMNKYPECKEIILPLMKKMMSSINDLMEKMKAKDEKAPKQDSAESLGHAALKERLDIGPKLAVGKAYKVTSLYGELYDGLCKPLVHRSGKELCDDAESLIKNIEFDFSKPETKTIFYRNKKAIGCFTFIWTNYDKLRITDYEVGPCK